MKRVAVVILNWNGIDYLKKFLSTVEKYSFPDADVWVIDNGSEDGSIQYLKEEHPSVNLVVNGKNLGFSGGYNLGLKSIKAEYYVLLNSDVEVSENWINPVIQYMDSEGISVCQPKILDYNKRDTFEHAGAAGGFIDKDGYTFCAGRIMNSFEEDSGQFDYNREIFWASGAAFFIKSETYFEVDGLDEDFFAHMEEIDLCWRLKNRGHRIGVCGASKVYHVGGGTLNKSNPFKTFLNFRNNLYLLTKNYFLSPLIIKLFFRLILDGIAGIKFLLEGKPKDFFAVIKAHFSFYYSSPKMFKKRSLEKNQTHQSNNVGMFHGSLIREYFIKGKHHIKDIMD